MSGSGDEFDQLAESLNVLFTRIESLMSGLQQVSTDIAHDLRTPMTRLRQRLELAYHRDSDVASLRAVIARSMRDVDTTLETFGALLRVAEIEAKTRKAGFTVFDFSVLLRMMVDDYRPVAEEEGREIAMSVADHLFIEGDYQLLTQMLANLIENAIRHTPKGTRIDLAGFRDGDAVVAEISDQGPGIPEDKREKVFQRLYRLEASRTTPGTGMGLSIVAAIAAQHQVTVTLLDNRPGLRVRLQFPAGRLVVPTERPGLES